MSFRAESAPLDDLLHCDGTALQAVPRGQRCNSDPT